MSVTLRRASVQSMLASLSPPRQADQKAGQLYHDLSLPAHHAFPKRLRHAVNHLSKKGCFGLGSFKTGFCSDV
jgi:hypothetical protein